MSNAGRLMTPSRYRCFHECQRLHHYKYELGIRPRKKAGPLAYGTLVHAALEAWWTHWMMRKKIEKITPGHALKSAMDALERARPESLDEYTFALISALVVGYDVRWGQYMDRIEVLEVEAEYRSPLVHPSTDGRAASGWQAAGKLDLIYGFDGGVYGMEHKTSSADLSPGSWYWTKLRMDPQLSAYFDGAAYLCNGKSYQLDGFQYDVIAKPKLQPYQAVAEPRYTKGTLCGTEKKPCAGRSCTRCKGTTYKPCGTTKNPCGGEQCDRCPGSGFLEPRVCKGQRLADETVDEYRERIIETICKEPARWYHRQSVVRLDSELREAREDYWATAMRISAFGGNGADDELIHAPKNTEACFSRGKGNGCPFFGVCSGAGSIDSDEFEHVGPHPELEHSP